MCARPLSAAVRRIFDVSGLGSSHEPIDVAEVRSRLARHYHLTGHLESVATEKDDTFRLKTLEGDYLVKVSPPGEAEAVIGLQTAAVRFLEGSAPELPVQRVILTTEGRDAVVLETKGGMPRVLRVFGFVEGVLWAHTNPDAKHLAKVGHMLGRIDTVLARFAHPADPRELVWDLRHFHALAELADYPLDPRHRQLAGEVLGLFGQTILPVLNDLETQVIHGDYSPYNVVIDKGSDEYVTGVIDFGDTMRSAVIFDPAVSVANLLGRTPDQPWADASAFIAGYQDARPIMDRELPLVPVAALARLTLRALITNWRAGRVPERRAYLLSHAKDDWINVERAMATPIADVVAQLRLGHAAVDSPGRTASS